MSFLTYMLIRLSSNNLHNSAFLPFNPSMFTEEDVSTINLPDQRPRITIIKSKKLRLRGNKTFDGKTCDWL